MNTLSIIIGIILGVVIIIIALLLNIYLEQQQYHKDNNEALKRRVERIESYILNQ